MAGSLSKLVGTYDKKVVTKTSNGGGRSRSEGTQEQARASGAELANLSEWRVIVRTSNGVSVVVETVPVCLYHPPSPYYLQGRPLRSSPGPTGS